MYVLNLPIKRKIIFKVDNKANQFYVAYIPRSKWFPKTENES